MTEIVHFSKDDKETLCKQSASSYINCICDYKPSDFCPKCIENLDRVKGLKAALSYLLKELAYANASSS